MDKKEFMKVSFECAKCKGLQINSPADVLKESKELNGQTIELQYFVCPVCGSKNYVQADNGLSKLWLSKCINTTNTQINANKRGQKGKQSGKIKKIQIHLRKVRSELQKELEQNYQLNFVDYKVVGDNFVGL